MIIQLKVFGSLRYYPPNPTLMAGNRLELLEGTTVGQVMEVLNFPRRLNLLFLINKVPADRDSVLTDGDLLHILPQMSGG